MRGKIVECPEAIAQAKRRLGKFILATNELEAHRLLAEEMLRASGSHRDRWPGGEAGW